VASPATRGGHGPGYSWTKNGWQHLAVGGYFVIETNIPHLRHLPPGQDILGYRAGAERMVSYSFDHATQQYRGHYVKFTDGPGKYRTIPFRYVWPSELDLMAQLAGLRLRDRWANWNREPFTTDNRSHVSVWQKPKNWVKVPPVGTVTPV
jgi:hypothetical protein